MVALPQLSGLRLPHGYHALNFRLRELRQRFAVVGRKADDTADAAHALALEQRIGVVAKRGRVGQERGKIVGEHEWLGVIGVDFAVDARVARAKVAGGVVGGLGHGVGFFLLPLPRAFGAMRRNQNPAFGQGVIAAVGVVGGVEHGGHSLCSGVKQTRLFYGESLPKHTFFFQFKFKSFMVSG